MDLSVPPELEELILCSCCHLPFNDTDSIPKLFACRHYFCLKCVNTILQKGNELYCAHCWKRTELPGPEMKPESLPTYNAILYLAQNLNTLSLKTTCGGGAGGSKTDKQHSSSSTSPGGSNGNGNAGNGNSNGNGAVTCSSNSKVKKGENCMTHAMPNTLWCTKCNLLVCRACAATEEHRNHTVKSNMEAKETINSDISNELMSMQKTLNDVQHLVLKQRDFLLKILESCTTLKTQIETELINHIPTLEIAEMRESLGKAKICLDMVEQQSPADALKLYATLHVEKQRLQAKYQEMFLQCKLDDLIRNYGILFDFDLIKQALAQLQANVSRGSDLDGYNHLNSAVGYQNSILLLANYCISQLYSRHVLSNKQHQLMNNGNHYHPQQQPPSLLSSQNSPRDAVTVKTYADITTCSPKSNQHHHHPHHPSNGNNNGFSAHMTDGLGVGPVAPPPPGVRASAPPGVFDLNGLTVPALTMMHLQQHSNQVQKTSQSSSLICNPSVHVYPIYYFNIEMNGQPCGRILIEVRNDVAPKMAKNFGALATSELGFGYKGCQIFQCWENESIITGDFELNNGRGGRSVFEEGFFMPDDTKILAIRGSVGMRRSQKRHDNLGLVGSQFRIILREMRGFTGIFAFVIDGLELIEKISQTGDSAGKPQSNVAIVSCGKYQ